MATRCLARLVLACALPGAAIAEVLIKVLKDYNIGYGHGTGSEAPGTPVAKSPFMIFHGHVGSPTACADACVDDDACTGFVHTDDKSENHKYDNTCYFRTDGCHDTSCDKAVRKQSHHESGFLYCAKDPSSADSPAKITQQQLAACGHDEGLSLGLVFVLVFLLASAVYVGGGLAYGRRTRGGGGLASHPHFQRWSFFAGLVMDGVGVVRGCKDGGGGVRTRSAATTASASRDDPRNQLAVSVSSHKSGKSGKKQSKKGGGNSKKTKKAHAEPLLQPATGTLAAQVPPPTREWQPTRTGHLAAGARETGVKVQL